MKTPPPFAPEALSFRYTLKSGGKISDDGMLESSHDSVPITISACDAVIKLFSCAFLPATD